VPVAVVVEGRAAVVEEAALGSEAATPQNLRVGVEVDEDELAPGRRRERGCLRRRLEARWVVALEAHVGEGELLPVAVGRSEVGSPARLLEAAGLIEAEQAAADPADPGLAAAVGTDAEGVVVRHQRQAEQSQPRLRSTPQARQPRQASG